MPSRILLVEDNANNADMLSRRLSRRGFAVMLASDGHAAIAQAQRDLPDLILMDMGLPALDGWETTRRLRADPTTAGIPIIALTAYALVSDRTKSLDAGCDEFETKPVEISRLLTKIVTLLGRGSAR